MNQLSAGYGSAGLGGYGGQYSMAGLGAGGAGAQLAAQYGMSGMGGGAGARVGVGLAAETFGLFTVDMRETLLISMFFGVAIKVMSTNYNPYEL